MDLDGNDSISFSEFLGFIQKVLKESGEEAKDEDSQKHKINDEEKEYFSKIIQDTLSEDDLCKRYFPIDPQSKDLFKAVDDGVIFCKLVNHFQHSSDDSSPI